MAEDLSTITIRIVHDDDPINPIDDREMLATRWLTPDRGSIDLSSPNRGVDLDDRVSAVYWRWEKRIDTSTPDPAQDPAELCQLIEKYHRGAVAEPISLDNHTGVGYVLPAAIRAAYMLTSSQRITAKIKRLVRQTIAAEAEEIQAWAAGDCWGYIIEDADGEELDSCWGFYGSEYVKDAALAAARSHLD